MNWLQKIASDTYYENIVFNALKKLNLIPAIEALEKHGPRGMDLWVKFKDEFKQNAELLSNWILNMVSPPPQYEAMDEIDEWAANALGIKSRPTGGVPKKDFHYERSTGGLGRGRNKNEVPIKYRKKNRQYY